ncbi:uncharacterized protein LOC110038837, partial [Phalaenopsis equestris]|uniref:uncharacterized protein LOC110038837 n=1 Tax=Phalaenopsis equestris TaxID=78828 RepID=UPI0009E31C8B
MAGHGAPEKGSNASCGKPITLSSFYNEIMTAASTAIRHLLKILGLKTSSQGPDHSPTGPPPPLSISHPSPPPCNITIRKPANWSLLSPHLLITIAEKLFVADIIRLPLVCKTWAWSLGLPLNGWPNPPSYRASFVPIPPSIPWMLLLNKNSEQADFISFLKLSESQLQLISPVPEMVGRRCVGASPDGWLVTLDLDLNPRVLNPLTREELPLPSLFSLFSNPAEVTFLHDNPDGFLVGFFTKHAATGAESYHARECFRDAYFLKIVLTSSPPFGVATVFYGIESLQTQLAFARVGDVAWTPVPVSSELSSRIEDVMYRKEDPRLYAVNSSGCLMFFDLHICDWPSGLWKSPEPLPVKPTAVAHIKGDIFGINRRSHLVFLSGRFLRICRSVNAYKDWEAEMLRLGLSLEGEDEDGDEDEDVDVGEDEGEPNV